MSGEYIYPNKAVGDICAILIRSGYRDAAQEVSNAWISVNNDIHQSFPASVRTFALWETELIADIQWHCIYPHIRAYEKLLDY